MKSTITINGTTYPFYEPQTGVKTMASWHDSETRRRVNVIISRQIAIKALLKQSDTLMGIPFSKNIAFNSAVVKASINCFVAAKNLKNIHV